MTAVVPPPVRLLLADDHTMLREGLSRSLAALGYEIAGEAGDGAEALTKHDEVDPDVVLMDVTMPVLDGIEATRRLLIQYPAARVIMLTMHADEAMVQAARDAGAVGYLVKDCTTEDITGAIDRAVAGETTFPDVTVDEPSEQERPLITAREAEVLQLIADGKNTTEAARALYVSAKTVKNHLSSAYSKLDAHDRTQAVLRAARLGYITLSGED